ncbi:MAG: SusC/RagA family TonB-linked outer membrane protein [Saprospiraceae bacterium]|nr:SusC/RagA family TonB-linked outer membrane protein [Saprospiraceae bacterium]
MATFYKCFKDFAKILVILLISSSITLCQKVITGVVKDAATGESLIGANIITKQDNSIGTITDFDGNFEIKVPAGTSYLQISYTGYTTIEVDVTLNSYIDVSLSAGQILDDVIVIGYGTVKREDATGSVQAVNSKDFNRGAITSPQELLAGKVAGVAITTGGGPDDGAQIRIRGQSSLSASNDPLIVIDGIPVDNGGVSGNRNPLNVINPNDIESMTVLKDASATAIYGSRASAGVILITTKKGSLGSKLKVGYTGNVSFGQTANRVDVLKADEYRALIASTYPAEHPSIPLLGEGNTDWQDEIYRTAFGQDHNVNLTGSLGQIPYRASLGYTYKDGLLKTDHFARYSAGINLSPRLLDNTLQMNVGLKAILSNNQFAERGAIGSALSWDPTQKPLDPDSKYSGYTTWIQAANGNPNGLAPANPVALLDKNLRNDQSDVVRYIANASADYRFKFLPSLRANLNVGYDFSRGKGSLVIPGGNDVAFSFQQDFGGGVNNSYEQERTNSVLEFYLNYKKDLNKDHSVDLMGGYSWQRFFNSSSFRNSDAAGTPAFVIERNNIEDELYLLSLFSRLNYDFKNKYLFTFSLRSDATSRFSPETRWGLFPAVALAVKLIENENQYFNNIKIRTGWGVTGQQAIGGGSYVYQPIYQLSLQNANYQFGEDFINTFRPNGYDANIKWEETATYNVGLDFSAVKGVLSGSLELYQRNTKDLLNFIQVPAGTNLTNFIYTNIGNMENRGVELSLNLTALNNSNFSWDIGFNAAYNTNEVTKLTALDDPEYIGVPTGGIAGGVGSNIQIHSVGFAPSSFFVFEQLYDENGNLLEGQFADRNGDGVVDDLDKYRFNKPAADVIMGITSNFRFKKLDFSFAGRANLGNYVYDNVATDMGYLQRLYHPTDYLQNIHRSGVNNNVSQQRNLTFSDHFVTDASFFRLDHITLGYSFENLLGKYLRIYSTVQNPFVITKYKGLDPELGNGIDNNVYPRPRTFVFGLSVDF